MNKFGKSLTVAIFFMSLLLMSFALVFCAGQQNWDAYQTRPIEEVSAGRPLGINHRLAELRKENTAYQEEIERLKATRDAARKLWYESLAKAEQTRLELEAARDQLEAQYAQVSEQLRAAEANFKAAQEQEVTLRTDVEALKAKIERTRVSRDEQLQLAVQLLDKLNQATADWERFKARYDQLKLEVSAYEAAGATAKRPEQLVGGR